MMPRILFLTVYTKIIVECPLAATLFSPKIYVNPRNVLNHFVLFLYLILIISALSFFFLTPTVHVQFFLFMIANAKIKLNFFCGSSVP